MSTPRRFFVDRIEEEVALTGDEFRHAKNVLRMNTGDEATLLDGSGKEFSAIVVRAEKGALILHVVGERPSSREPKADVCLLVGALKGDKTELVVQKAVELGANRIGVFASRYSGFSPNENKLERLSRVSREAAKQCLRARAPQVDFFPTLGEALAFGEGYRTKLFACEFLPSGEGEIPTSDSYCLVVGSEGGFAEEEFALARAKGYLGVSLGRRILRAETAAIALLSVAMYRAGELK